MRMKRKVEKLTDVLSESLKAQRKLHKKLEKLELRVDELENGYTAKKRVEVIDDGWLRAVDAANKHGVNTKALYNLASRGRVKRRKYENGAVYVWEEDVKKYAREQNEARKGRG